MSHAISGFAGPFDPLAASAGLGGRAVARLGCGWGFLPVEPTGDAGDPDFPAFEYLTPALAAWAARMSKRAPVVYLETEYWGGEGMQAAVAWDGGAVVARGVTRTSDVCSAVDYAINTAARRAGARRDPAGPAADEFDALGLGRHRSNAGWTAEAELERAPPPADVSPRVAAPAPTPADGVGRVTRWGGGPPRHPQSNARPFVGLILVSALGVLIQIGKSLNGPRIAPTPARVPVVLPPPGGLPDDSWPGSVRTRDTGPGGIYVPGWRDQSVTPP